MDKDEMQVNATGRVVEAFGNLLHVQFTGKHSPRRGFPLSK